MSKRLFSVNAFTAMATADTTTTLANGTYLAVSAMAATNRCAVSEIYMGGQSTSSNVNIMMFARHTVVGATLTALSAPNSDGPMDGLTQVVTSAARGFVAATTPPERAIATTAARLALTYNSFGGIVRWVAPPGGEWFITGVTVTVSESSLSAYSGGAGGVMSAHIVYEQV